MRCIRSILKTIQSLNDKENEKFFNEKSMKNENFLIKNQNDLNCYLKKLNLNGELDKLERTDKLDKLDQFKYKKSSTDNYGKSNLAKLLWIKNSLIIDPFPDFTTNSILVVNKGYKKLFKLVSDLIIF